MPCLGQAMEVRIEGEHGELWYHVSNTTLFKTEPDGTIILLHGEGASSNYFAFLFKRLSKRNVRVRDAHDAVSGSNGQDTLTSACDLNLHFPSFPFPSFSFLFLHFPSLPFPSLPCLSVGCSLQGHVRIRATGIPSRFGADS
jgi:hypothetical protein